MKIHSAFTNSSRLTTPKIDKAEEIEFYHLRQNCEIPAKTSVDLLLSYISFDKNNNDSNSKKISESRKKIQISKK